MLEQVLKTISRYNMLACPAPASTPLRLAVAVSGGPDSVCLLYALKELAPQLGIALSVAHFNHKLRGKESEEDEAFVSELATKLDLPFHRAEENVFASAFGEKDNLEQAARRARQAFFEQLRSAGFTDLIATGHTRDDQAETVLFRFLRGSGVAGLAGILPVTKQGIIRPFLEVTRTEIRDYLLARGIDWREDRSNLDPRFSRNRIRKSLLPELAREWNPNIIESLSQLADLAYEEERVWSVSTERRASKILMPWNGGMDLEVAAVKKLPKALSRRLIRRAVQEVKGDLRRIEFAHIEAVLELVEQSSGEGRLRLPDVDVTRSFRWVRLAPAGGVAVPQPISAAFPGQLRWPGTAAICLEVLQNNGANSCGTLKAADLDVDRLPAQLVLRGWRAGDRYWPLDQGREMKLAELFESAKVPSWRRPFWPMLTGGDKILWAKQFGVAREFAASVASRQILRVVEGKNRET